MQKNKLNIAGAELHMTLMTMKDVYDLSNDDILTLIGNLLMTHDWTVEDEEK